MPDTREPQITEDKTTGVVFIDGVRVWGFLQPPRPTSCNHQIVYSERYDALFCPIDDRWLEQACGDPSCAYCRDRPEPPLSGPLDEP